MKIIRARIYLVRIAGRHPVLVELETDEGVTGVGDAAIAYGSGGTAAAGMIKDLVDDVVLGKDPFRIEALWGEMYDHSFWAKGGGPIVFAGISAIETVAETYNMRVQPHLCASPVATAAALQLDAVIRNLIIQELYPYRVPEHFAIVDHAPELDVKSGRLAIPSRPGLGVALVPERVRPHLWAECA
jgi:L-alanine-DL-glutamate epimerase-like enolase superfamily enzyme